MYIRNVTNSTALGKYVQEYSEYSEYIDSG